MNVQAVVTVARDLAFLAIGATLLFREAWAGDKANPWIIGAGILVLSGPTTVATVAARYGGKLVNGDTTTPSLPPQSHSGS